MFGYPNETLFLVFDILLQLFPEMQVYEMHAIYDKRYKVSSFLKSHQNTYNSVKCLFIKSIESRWPAFLDVLKCTPFESDG